MGDVLAADPDLAGVGALQAGEDPQRGRLAAARRAEQHHHLARLDVEAEPVEGVDVP